VRFVNVANLTNTDRQEFQTFIDYSTRMGTLPDPVDVTKYLQRF
jgi:hypothetical protein